MGDNSSVFMIMAVIFIALIVLVLRRSNTAHKPAHMKKEEISKEYEYELMKVIAKYENDPELLKKKKIEFLKEANQELNNNLFFDETEAKVLLQKLASL